MRGRQPRVDATELARNHWRFILTQLGVEEKALSGNHGPCPACGGEDRFRFDNRNGEGSHFCSGCGAGSGYQLLMKMHGWDFKKALAEVQRLVGDAPEEEPKPREMPESRKRQLMNDIWLGSKPCHEKTIEYLVGRGLSLATAHRAAEHLRYGMVFHKGEGRDVPAMVALVQNSSGKPVTLHRTYLFEDGRREKRTMPCLGEMNGSAVRLAQRETGTLVIGEGIETTLAAMEMTGEEGWAAVSANGMQTLQLNPVTKRVIICGDNDAKYAGQAAAYTLAHRLACKLGDENVEVRIPERPGMDFLDVLNEQKQRSIRDQTLAEGGNK